MKNAKSLPLIAGLLVVAPTASAQESTRFAVGIGLAARAHTGYGSGFVDGLAHRPWSGGAFSGLGAFARPPSPALGQPYYVDHDGYFDHGAWILHDCWDNPWHDPWFGCGPQLLIGYPSFGWWHPYPVRWWFGHLGWPSTAYVRYQWYHPGYAHGPFAYHGWDWWGPSHHHIVYHDPPHRHLHRGNDGHGYATPKGYRSRGRAKPHGRGGDRIVRGSPLFGPRYKEDPTASARDGGRRNVGRAVPRGGRAGAGVTDARSRLREAPKTRRPRPHGQTPGADADRRRPAPKVRSGTPRQPAPTTQRRSPTRRVVQTARPAPRQRPPDAARAKPSRRMVPRARPAPTRRPAPKAKAPAPKRQTPKARPAPTRRPAPKAKASAPKRQAPKARPAPTRRSGTSKRPPRRGGRG